MKLKKKRSIKTRIFVVIILFIIGIFTTISCSFNILVRNYINSTCNTKLNEMKQGVEEKRAQKGLGLNYITNHLNRKEKRGKLQGEVKIMVIDKEYNIIDSCKVEEENDHIEEFQEISENLKKKEINLDYTENLRIRINESNYYVSFLNSEEDTYIVFIIDITEVLHFARKMNVMLCAAVCFASIIAVFVAHIIARRIADPIEELQKFAKQIGQGNFHEYKYDFKDREIAELCAVMNKSAQYLDKYDKEQKVFFQNVSHELRTPLMSIKGYAEAIKYDMIDKKEAGDIILDEGNRLEELIEELLYISRMDNITKDYKMDDLDLREILSDCTIKEKSLALKRNIEFEFDFDDKPVMMMCEEKSIYRAFLNIIDNGIRYAQKKYIYHAEKKIMKL